MLSLVHRSVPCIAHGGLPTAIGNACLGIKASVAVPFVNVLLCRSLLKITNDSSFE